jgi:hypothetical protein
VRRIGALASGPAVRAAVTIIVLLVVLRGVDGADLGALLGSFEPLYFAVAVLVAALANGLGALGWKSLLDALDVRLPHKEVGRLYVIGLFFALFTPGGVAGDVVRTYELQRRGSRGVEGFTSILVARVLSVATLAVLGAVSAMAILPELVSSQVTVGVLGVSVLMLGALLMSGRSLKPMAERLPWRRLARVAGEFLESVEVLRRHPRALVAASLLYILHHLLIVTAIFFAALALDIDVSFRWVLALVPIARVLVLLPLSISGLGIQEAAFVVLFKQVGLEPAAAFSLSLLSQVALIAVPLAGGAIFLLRGRSAAVRNATSEDSAVTRSGR